MKSKKKAQSRSKETEEMFEVEKIVDKKILNGVPSYLVKWDGYSEKDSINHNFIIFIQLTFS